MQQVNKAAYLSTAVKTQPAFSLPSVSYSVKYMNPKLSAAGVLLCDDTRPTISESFVPSLIVLTICPHFPCSSPQSLLAAHFHKWPGRHRHSRVTFFRSDDSSSFCFFSSFPPHCVFLHLAGQWWRSTSWRSLVWSLRRRMRGEEWRGLDPHEVVLYNQDLQLCLFADNKHWKASFDQQLRRFVAAHWNQLVALTLPLVLLTALFPTN